MKPVVLGSAAMALAACGAAARYLRNWNAAKHECDAVLPGDELVAEPARQTTSAISIDASAEHVWSWLVQIGQDRGGMYSYDLLENLFGLQIHSADRITPAWQHLAVGDRVGLIRPGWLGLQDGYALDVHDVVPGRTLVLHDPAWPAVWSFHLRPTSTHSCRLISRSRGPRSPADHVLGPVQALMTRRMLLGLNQRAERVAPTHPKEPHPCPPSPGSATSASPTPTRSAGRAPTSAS